MTVDLNSRKVTFSFGFTLILIGIVNLVTDLGKTPVENSTLFDIAVFLVQFSLLIQSILFGFMLLVFVAIFSKAASGQGKITYNQNSTTTKNSVIPTILTVLFLIFGYDFGIVGSIYSVCVLMCLLMVQFVRFIVKRRFF